MNKFPIITTALMIIGFVASIFLSQEMAKMRRADIYKDNPQRLDDLVYVPTLGMDKFWADLNWIRLLQTMGDPKTALKTPKDNDDTEKKRAEGAAMYFFDQINYISDRNPDFTLLYQVAPMYISNIVPEKAIELLEKGNKYAMKPDYKRYWYASFIVDRYMNDDPQNPTEENIKKSLSYLEPVVNDFTGYPFHIYRSFLRNQMRLIPGFDQDDPLAVLKLEQKYFNDLRDQLKKQYSSQTDPSAAGEMPKGPDGKPLPEAEAMPPMDEMAFMDMGGGETDSTIGKLAERIKDTCRSLAVEKRLAMRDPEKTDAEKAKHKTLHEEIVKIYNDVTGGREQHISRFSLRPIEPGDIYDVWTGDPLDKDDWYGFDIGYFEKTGVIIKLRGQFSPVTGSEIK